MPKSLTRRSAAVLAAGVLSFGVGAPLAHAGDGEVRTNGTCSNGATWKLKAKPDNDRIEVEFEVDTNRNGQTWGVVLRDNGTLVYRGTHTTVAPSGSFSVERRIANRAGTDVITARATHASGAVCSGLLSFPG